MTSLVSYDRCFCLCMQNDGNLVTYDGQGHATCTSGTHDRGVTDIFAIIQSDGNLVIYNNSPIIPLSTSNNHGPSSVEWHRKEN